MFRDTIRGWFVLLLALAVSLLTASPAGAASYVNDLIGIDTINDLFPNIDGVDDSTSNVQRIAVFDSGIQTDHPGLDGRVVAGINFAAGFDYESTNPAHYVDLNGHGTFVTGVLGSSLDGLNGIAPNVEFVSVRILSASGSGDFYDVAGALEWVVDNAAALNITAVNISMGSSTTYAEDSSVPGWSTMNRMRTAFDTLADMDVVTVVASGNGGSTTGLSIPAVFDNVIAVGASTSTDAVWNSSNRNDTLEMLAPGASVSSLWLNDGQTSGSGTSYAAPVVTASAVLMREFIELYDVSLAGDFDNFQERFLDILQQTGTTIGDSGSGLTYDRIDMAAAFDLLATELGVEASVPEPASLMLFGAGLMVINRRRRPRRIT